ncbi:hypothetical protein C1Y18_16160 [Pseudomonas sp. MPR-R5A]|nr:hypothetical protein C1Y25_11110 [Pseudomonas sp. MPBC4-3]PMX47446.1 hypothetical protein C1Y20_13530 [Pseudomonas sp. FW301-21B01]PMY06564.1 hypothetical protein C1Y18_16160 [Pseudomonas sp. MPR-R5A]PNA71739.1 hypothetical protein C1Y14_05020 [Pseudomonas sp. MPR-R5B]
MNWCRPSCCRASKHTTPPPVGASLLAKNSRTPHSSRMHALSLTSFASKLAPTGIRDHIGSR